MDSDNVAVDVLQALTWPVVALVAIVLLRPHLGRALEAIGGRTTKVSVLNILALDLAPAPVAALDWRVQYDTGLIDLRQLTSANVFDSYANSLFEQLLAPTPAEVAVINLGKGNKWLTSRLYMFAILLEQQRGVRCLVFTETRDGITNRLLGLANPEVVWRALAAEDPELVNAYERALRGALGRVGWKPLAPRARLDPRQASMVARLFLDDIQRRARPPKQVERYWQSFTSDGATMWERTSWIDPRDLPGDLDEVIDRTAFVVENRNTRPAGRVRDVLLHRSQLVAIVDEHRRYEYIVDRAAMLDDAVRQILVEDSTDGTS